MSMLPGNEELLAVLVEAMRTTIREELALVTAQPLIVRQPYDEALARIAASMREISLQAKLEGALRPLQVIPDHPAGQSGPELHPSSLSTGFDLAPSFQYYRSEFGEFPHIRGALARTGCPAASADLCSGTTGPARPAPCQTPDLGMCLPFLITCPVGLPAEITAPVLAAHRLSGDAK